jgi:hypothetical protein
MSKAHIVIHRERKQKVETDCRLGLEMIPDYETARQDISKLIKKKKSVGWVTDKKRRVILEYEYDIKQGYLKEHPERRQELYKYGDIEDAPHEWTVRAYVQDKDYKTICKGKLVVIR